MGKERWRRVGDREEGVGKLQDKERFLEPLRSSHRQYWHDYRPEEDQLSTLPGCGPVLRQHL